MWNLPPPTYGKWRARAYLAVGIVGATVILLLASAGFYSHYVFSTRGVETSAAVVELLREGEPDRQYRVRFMTADGEVVETFTSTRRTNQPVGSQVQIVYDPEAPDYAQEVTGQRWYVEPAFFAATGLFVAGVVAWAHLRWKRWHN